MSRSQSPSWALSPSSSTTSTSTITPPHHLPYHHSNSYSATRPSMLRVDTTGSSGSSSATPTRLRSNSAMSPPMSHSPNGYTFPHHNISRSMSHANSELPSRPGHTSGAGDVTMGTNGPRGGLLSPTRAGGSGSAQGQGGDSPFSAYVIAVTMKRIQEALDKSEDEGDTIDLSRRQIEVIGDAAVNVLSTVAGKENLGVWRLALSYNSLRDGSIVDSFSSLSRMRYLNLKGNHLTFFPHALTDMPALEILDISKNRLTSFPEKPGRLTALKVLSLSHNRIYTLPSYMIQFSVLKVFKVDGNPIEWPPREVLGELIESPNARARADSASVASGQSKKDEDLRPWIENMKSWMRQRAAETDRLLTKSQSDEEAYLGGDLEQPLSAMSLEDDNSINHWKGPQQSLPNNLSQQTVRLLRDEVGRAISPTTESTLGRQNRAATNSEESLDPFPAPRSLSHHTHSTSTSSFSTPPPSASTASSSHSRNPSYNLPLPPAVPAAVNHIRGASYTVTQRLSANLTAKKSLPDLRQNHAQIIEDRRKEAPIGSPKARPLGLGIRTPTAARLPAISPKKWSADMTKSPTSAGAFGGGSPRNLLRKGSADMLRNMKSNMGLDYTQRPTSGEGEPADESRNSYFRRLSTLPTSTISKTIPQSLLHFVDAIRGILFALSQLHSALRQYLTFAVNERIASLFSRLMEPASTYMNNLINALDRFDSMFRRGTPPLHALRAVIDTTKESVGVLGKVVSVLRLQIPAIRGSTDVRYTRTLLLMIYGSMAEVALSWQNMVPLLSDIVPLLATDGSSVVARALMGGHKMVPTGSLTGRTPISPIPERGESHSPPSVPRSSVPLGNSPLNEQVQDSPAPAPLLGGVGSRSRRKGGSFSTQDVERGMMMGSPVGAKIDKGEEGYSRHRPSESAQIILEEEAEESEADEDEAQETLVPLPTVPVKAVSSIGAASNVPITPPEIPQKPQPIAIVPVNSQHSNGMRRGHHPSSSSGSLFTGMPGPVRKLSVDVRPPTPASATLFDEDLLDAVETAVEIAFTVWRKVAEDVEASSPPFVGNSGHMKSASQSSSISSQPDSARMPHARRPSTISVKLHSDLLNLLSSAEQITTNLRESLMGLRANPHTYHHTTLPDDAQTFIKTVVKVSGLVKIISASHNWPSGVRQSCSRLTQHTRECAILLQVSSLRPGTSTPAPIPPTPGYWSRNGSVGGSIGGSVEDLSAGSISSSMGNGGPLQGGGGWVGGISGGGSGLRGFQLSGSSRAFSRARSAGLGGL